MIDIVFWIIIGALSGWVGYLAARNDKETVHLHTSVAVGIFGAVLGGVLMRVFGLTSSNFLVSTESIAVAMILSALTVTGYAVLANFLGTTSAN